MDADVVQNYVLAELVDRATDKRHLDIDPDVLAHIKALCRAREENAVAAADLLLDHLKANDAQVLRVGAAGPVCNQLRSCACLLLGSALHNKVLRVCSLHMCFGVLARAGTLAG